ncbi:MAG TPA: SDR family NAD(P)-dependent oxidoreductase [Bacteroidales bacterium]|jgi:NAD(P)-dependent dehydrogenase (short-subunit alcohol dehydrogenase family)|nr:SDR family NAD(P)-dependent oxidoreductase [Bacteroidales bacterium]MCZ2416453.1 SDR family NAD(P)-dependent oxidoreductase [Burkholderiales bacterium]OQC58050.1 MAG: Acetoacetyl-CoA reductase [Bacteroidetes bacterium ADurb.Bin013]NLZ08604.1 SDR family NAD(P)-dependent oxidoreductase [Bacteroidales bacterium]HOF76487.1 SDR family NAD(P)-dependent oxidoreductase [Bacteroidales bacterium]
MKTAVVTGADGGMGREICRSLLDNGYSLIMACLLPEAAMPFFRELQEKYIYPGGSLSIRMLQLDLASFASVRSFASALEGTIINRLIHNAGILPLSTRLTEDGYDMISQVNYRAPLYLTRLLIPQLEMGSATEDGARIIFTLSCTVDFGLIFRLRPSFLTHVPKTWAGRVIRYSHTKQALYYASLSLAEKLKGQGIQVVSADPGAVNTPLVTMNNFLDPLVNIFFRPLLSSPAKGASTAIWLATAGELSQPYGGTYRKCKPRRFLVCKNINNR